MNKQENKVDHSNPAPRKFIGSGEDVELNSLIEEEEDANLHDQEAELLGYIN